MKKVVLAFSGGLDTSFAVPYLMDQGYQVITVTVDTGGFSLEELQTIENKAHKLGAHKHYLVDGKRTMYEQIIAYIIKTNGLYQGSYPNMCADRYTIAQEVLKIAIKENSQVVAHGSTAMGNDQVRFDIALMTLSPEMKILSPIKEIGGNRKKEQQFLAKKGFKTAKIHQKYSVNQNILGLTYSGSEIDQLQEPDQNMFLWTNKTKTEAEYIKISFEKGLPISLNDKQTSGTNILQQLNELVGSHGYGKGYYTGDCMVGIKGHIAFEAPGILALIQAHQALEQLVLTKHQQTIGHALAGQFTDLVYTGKFFDPATDDLKAFIDSQQKYVTGEVTLKLEESQIYPVGLTSPYSLIQPQIASYAQHSTWSAAEADGFIKLFGMQSRIAAMVHHQKISQGGSNVK